MRTTNTRKAAGSISVLALATGTTLLLSFPSQAATEGDFSYSVSDGTATVTGYTGAATAIDVPSTVGDADYPVTAIGEGAFYNRDLVSATVPDSVTTIGDGAFANNELTSFSIPDTMTTIGLDAFHNNHLVDLNIPDSVSSIGWGSFGSNHLSSIDIGAGLTTISGGTFANNRLRSITIPDNVDIIEEYAFESNELTSVVIGASVTEIGIAAFGQNSSLTTATFTGPAPAMAMDPRDGTAPFGPPYPEFTVWYPAEHGSNHVDDGYTSPEWQGYPSEPYAAQVTATTQTAETPYGTPARLKVAVADRVGPVHDGEIQVIDNDGVPLGDAVALSEDGRTTISVVGLPIGIHNVSVQYTTPEGVATATSSSVPIDVVAATTTTDISIRPTSPVTGQKFDIVVEVAADAPSIVTPHGDVTVRVDREEQTGPLNADGVVTFSFDGRTAGVHAVRARYAAPPEFSSSEAEFEGVIAAAETAVSINTPERSTFGEPFSTTGTVVVIEPGAGSPHGVAVLETRLVGAGMYTAQGTPERPDKFGNVQFRVTGLDRGTYDLRVVYRGDGNFASSESTTVTHVVEPQDDQGLTPIPTPEPGADGIPEPRSAPGPDEPDSLAATGTDRQAIAIVSVVGITMGIAGAVLAVRHRQEAR
ncbi:leucine-rich repeat protein [Microbacterium karelineae]|uniref:leucine-rich repeat protein n=1 Tax=Microbacterium karelineae TaxID=2654283 RepID=UPI0018D2C369|nr:leucine-rich repeat protein [Microbacterium karelineae]